jgi:hypothetical protein
MDGSIYFNGTPTYTIRILNSNQYQTFEQLKETSYTKSPFECVVYRYLVMINMTMKWSPYHGINLSHNLHIGLNIIGKATWA